MVFEFSGVYADRKELLEPYTNQSDEIYRICASCGQRYGKHCDEDCSGEGLCE